MTLAAHQMRCTTGREGTFDVRIGGELRMLSMRYGILALSLMCTTWAAAAKPWPPELAKVQQEYAQRRAEAVRAATAWYRAQLEVLRTQHAAEPAYLAALNDLRETYWTNDQPELTRALITTPWIWRSDVDANGVVVTFYGDGRVEHIGLRGTWRITGPSEVTIQTGEGDAPMVLRFNASLAAYEANRNLITGQRLALAR